DAECRAQQRALARTVLAEQHCHASRLELEVEAVERAHPAVALLEADGADRDALVAHHPFTSCPSATISCTTAPITSAPCPARRARRTASASSASVAARRSSAARAGPASVT